MYYQSLKAYWKSILNNIVPIQETVTKNGVRLYNINEDYMLQTFISIFFRILYNSEFFLVYRKTLEDYTRTYGIDIAVEMIVKHLLRSSSELPTRIANTNIKGVKSDKEEENKGLLFEK